jgi:hypothetical protein
MISDAVIALTTPPPPGATVPGPPPPGIMLVCMKLMGVSKVDSIKGIAGGEAYLY